MSDPNCKHEWEEGFYGHKCKLCGWFVPFGSEPWVDVQELDAADIGEPWVDAQEWEIVDVENPNYIPPELLEDQ